MFCLFHYKPLYLQESIDNPPSKFHSAYKSDFDSCLPCSFLLKGYSIRLDNKLTSKVICNHSKHKQCGCSCIYLIGGFLLFMC